MSRQRGLFLKLPALESVELVAASPLDFAVIDLEHTQLSEADALRLVRHAHALQTRAIVRIPQAFLIGREFVARTHGVTMTVRNLFANVPARLKFISC